MAGQLSDCFSDTATADYVTTTLSVACHEVLEETYGWIQKAHKMDDGNLKVVTKSSRPYPSVTLLWRNISATDAQTILDFFIDSSKARGMARTFYWLHPVDGETYVVRFVSDITKSIFPTGRRGVTRLTLRVEGVKA